MILNIRPEGRILKIHKPDGTVEMFLEHTDPNMYDNRIQFVIQWCDWNIVQGMFAQIDGNIRRGEFGYKYEVIKRKVLYGYRSPSSHDFVCAHTDLYESEVKRRIDFF